MDTKTLAAAIAGFLLGGFVTSVAATLEDDPESHGSAPATSRTATVSHDGNSVEPPLVPGRTAPRAGG